MMKTNQMEKLETLIKKHSLAAWSCGIKRWMGNLYYVNFLLKNSDKLYKELLNLDYIIIHTIDHGYIYFYFLDDCKNTKI